MYANDTDNIAIVDRNTKLQFFGEAPLWVTRLRPNLQLRGYHRFCKLSITMFFDISILSSALIRDMKQEIGARPTHEIEIKSVMLEKHGVLTFVLDVSAHIVDFRRERPMSEGRAL